MVKSKKFEIELHYDDRCNYVLFRKGKNFAYYLEVTEEELTGMERSLGIDLTDDNAGIKSDVLAGVGMQELKDRRPDEGEVSIDDTIKSVRVFNSAFSKAFGGNKSEDI